MSKTHWWQDFKPFSAKKKIKIWITIIAIIAAASHLIFPQLKIDAITAIFFIIAIIPWLEPLFKSVELPGGIKVEFQDLEKVSKEAKEAGIIQTDTQLVQEVFKEKPEYAFIELANINQQIALVGLRIEIEKRLRELAKKYSLPMKYLGVNQLIDELTNKNIIDVKEKAVFKDIIGTLNHAAHGVEYDPRTADWIIQNGPEILRSLDLKLEIRGGYFSVGRSDEKIHWIDKSYEECKASNTRERNECIAKHIELWKKEMDNIYNSLLQKLDSSQKEKLIQSNDLWKKQFLTEQDFIYSFSDLQQKVGSGGKMIIGLNFMNKIRQRTLELEEILNHFTEK